MKVICYKDVYDCGEKIDVYKVGGVYNASYLYDKVLMEDDTKVISVEFEWMVYCSEHNHYQFTDHDFKLYFKDIEKERDRKISHILNI